MRESVEQKLGEYLPEGWGRRDVLFYLHHNKYKVDLDALNKNLRDPSRDFLLRGGKRIRPTLFLACIELFGSNPREYLDYAAAIEMIHNGTLILDDIEDKAELRRGKPASHKKYGLDTATNVGMGLHILPLNIILSSKNKITSYQKERVMRIYTEELTNVSFGQALDIYWHKHHPENVSLEEYLEMVRLKTGSLMRMSTRLACALTNRTPDTEELFKDLAENLGIAFQIIDDCLDLDPPSEKFGKSFGNDITEGKLSLPVIKALGSISKSERETLSGILHRHTRNKKYISEAIKIIKDSGAVDDSRKFAKEIAISSWKEMEHKWARRNNLKNLRELALFFVEREY